VGPRAGLVTEVGGNLENLPIPPRGQKTRKITCVEISRVCKFDPVESGVLFFSIHSQKYVLHMFYVLNFWVNIIR